MSGWAPTGYGCPWPSSEARAGAANAPAKVGNRPRWRVWLTRHQSADYGASGQATAHPFGTPCRTTHGSGTWVHSSLWRATSPGAPQPCILDVLGSSPLSRLWPLLPLTLNRGPFPPPALPGFDGITDLSDSPGGLACPSRASSWVTHPPPRGSRVASRLPVQTCRRHYPGGTAGRYRFAPRAPATAAFPVSVPGRLPHETFRGLLSVHACYDLPARGAADQPFPSKASAISLPPPPLRLLPAGAKVAG
jgi:hypothetical protein